MPELETLKFKIVVDSSEATSKMNGFKKSVQDFGYILENTKVKRATDSIRNMGNAARSSTGAFRSLKGTIGNLKLSTVALTVAAYKLSQGLASCVKQSMDFVETMNLFNVSMGDNAIAAGEFAEKVQQAFGIDMAQWMRNQGVFQTLIEGFGVASEKADVMSQQLTQLGYDLSSLFNLPFAESMQKLQSGIAGELEPLRRLGFDLSQAKLQQIAYDHGIQQSISTMTQAEKSQLRYYAIMTQVTTAHGDMARTIMQPANMLRVFKENVVIAARSIGNLLIPVMQALLSIAIIVARGIAKVANVIASIFGIQTDWRGFMDDLNYNGGGGIEDIADDLDDVGGAAGGATKKMKEFKKQFLGFDKINNITLPTEPSGGGGGGGGAGGVGGGDFDLPLPTYDFLQGIDDAFAKAHPKIQKIFDDLAEDFRNGGNNIGSILGEAIRYGLWSINWDNIKGIGNKIASKLADGLNDFLETPYLFLSVGETFAQTLNTIFSTANTFAKAFHWESLGTAISDSINGFFAKFDFALAGQAVSNWTKGILTSALSAVKGVHWDEVGGKIKEFLENLDIGGVLKTTLELGVQLLGALGQALEPVLEGVSDAAFSTVLELTGKAMNGLLDWVWKACTGDENAEFPLKIKLGDEKTKAIVDLLTWLEEIIQVGRIDLKLAFKIGLSGPGEGWGSWWDSLTGKDKDDTTEKNIRFNFKEGTWDNSLRIGGSAYELFENYRNKTAKVSVDTGKVDQSVKKGGKTYKTYEGFKDKTPLITIAGIIAQTAKNAFSYQSKFKDSTVTKTLTGSMTKAWDNEYTQYHSVYSRETKKTLTGATQYTFTNMKAGYDSVVDKVKSVGLSGYYANQDAKDIVKAIALAAAKTVVSIALSAIPGHADGGIFKNGRWQPITAAATGGSFNTGQMFIAREAGPELVGNIGGHTAVMNNNQIVSSVAAGVASANATQNALLQQLINVVQDGDQTIVLQVDQTRFGEVSIRSINKVQRQQGRTLLNV